MPELPPASQRPRHIAIIMDGNGRWAAKRGMERSAGHQAGADAVIRTIECCDKYAIPYLTLYAFSTENWKRSTKEVAFLMNLLVDFLDQQASKLTEYQIRLRVIGELERLPRAARLRLQQQISNTAAYTKGNLTLALSYGSRNEIAQAAQTIARLAKAGAIDPETLDEASFAGYLQTADLPDPDLIIRTGGEQRLSNFLLWQASYAEIWFTDTFWPDFAEPQFRQALEDFAHRQRRFGGT
ncbi:MAG TPA: polyprenyl diphosphate synthase [Lentisphaeria bacterium]|nr:di-trans,poly-cis-decaprenylcistransferase [Lentisphaerota bacterium]OQC17100.1 MAG: Ditrans,polycis-undecaprenyl-diphosphate synthase ((2E,6E)-farnesyl-diphosphate specific) [Lentisphaerae bacterium ADurb.Bin082]HQC52577.1 polyprenyl diphosphate synthase [Lentisphaeria bacterium]HQL86658.1 polyprenyl diphosphate synthase [Lentisphaeria bacterium]